MRTVTLALACSVLAWGQSKESDKKIEDALVAFGKAFAGTEAQKVEAIGKLSGLKHEKVFAELARCLVPKQSEAVRVKAIEVLSESDHPAVAKILADSVKPNLESRKVAKALVKAIGLVNWDIFHTALCEPLMLATLGGPAAAGDKEYGEAGWDYMGIVEKDAPVCAIDGFVKLLAKIEEGRRAGYRAPTDEWENRLRKCLKICTGAEKPTSKDYATYWKSSKTAQAQNLTYVIWCPATWKRWEHKGNDAKAFCPHHSDKTAASGETPITALTRNN